MHHLRRSVVQVRGKHVIIRHLWALSVRTRAFPRRYMLANTILEAVQRSRPYGVGP